MMKRLLLVCFFSMFALASQAASPASGEYIILVGGPSMYQWEKYKTYPHDHWWAKFILNLIWFGPGSEVINYQNNGHPRDLLSIPTLHSSVCSTRSVFTLAYIT